MIELGAYWGFYSLWFKKSVSGSRCFLVEPDLGNLKSGQANFVRNGEEGVFHQAYVGRAAATAADGIPVISVDAFCDERAIQRVNILHADIQGAEVEMLLGASRMLNERRIDFIFISTHSNELHSACLEHLASCRYDILAEADLGATHSYDGVIVAKSSGLSEPEFLEMNKKASPNCEQ